LITKKNIFTKSRHHFLFKYKFVYNMKIILVYQILYKIKKIVQYHYVVLHYDMWLCSNTYLLIDQMHITHIFSHSIKIYMDLIKFEWNSRDFDNHLNDSIILGWIDWTFTTQFWWSRFNKLSQNHKWSFKLIHISRGSNIQLNNFDIFIGWLKTYGLRFNSLTHQKRRKKHTS